MGGPTAAKRHDARGTSRRSSHLPYEVSGVVLITLSLLVLLSLLSFAPTDQFLFSPGGADQAGSTQTRNLIGTVGATLGGVLFQVVGGSAYLAPVFLALLGWRCFVEGTLALALRNAGGSLAAILFLSGLLHLELIGVPSLLYGWVYRGQAGGETGRLLAEGLHGYFASTGTHLILLCGLVVSLLLATPMSLAELWRRIPDWWAVLLEAGGRIQSRIASWLADWRRAEGTKPTKKTKPKPVKINRPITANGQESPEALQEDLAAVETFAEDVQPAASVPIGVEASVPDREDSPTLLSSPVSSGYRLPDPRDLLSDPSGPLERMTDEALKAQSEILIRALLSFGIEGKVTEVHPGPIVTMYEFEPAPGIKVARIVNLADDLALALKATSIRIVAPLPGKSVVGIEVPATYRETVSLKEVLTSEAFSRSRSKLTLALGKDIFGVPVVADLKSMPHLLVAGATGAGKSVSLNTMLLSILFSARPDEVKLLLVDPKVLELQVYDGIPHLLRPVITDPKSAARGLGWVVQEMEQRYKLLAEAGVRNIDAYNRKVAQAHRRGKPGSAEPAEEQGDLPMEFLTEEERLAAGESAAPEPSAAEPLRTPPAPLPYIVVMIDELADLMMVAPKEVEDKIARLAQMARASGIHLVLATQRPSVDVLTGLIKANFPARIAFQVSSKTDSRTILDANGAEALLGRGDMLFLAPGTGRITRIHGSFVPDDDVRRVVDFIKGQAAPAYMEALQSLRQEEVAEEQERDEVYEQAKDLVLSTGQASASLIQRRLRVGYPRAARMIERMEEEGLVGAAGRDGRREVLVRREPVEEDSV